MQTITPLTSEGTETTLNKSDTQMPNMSLGGGGAQIQSVTGSGVKSVKDAGAVDESIGGGGTMPNKPETKKETKEEKQNAESIKTEEKTQGDQAQRVDDINRAIEKWNELLNNSKYTSYDFTTKLNKYEFEQFENYLKDNNINPNEYLKRETISGFISHLMGNYKNELHGIKTDPVYDNRTDEQIRNDKLLEEQRQRDDSAHQRMVDDMRAAGLNPAAFKGANYGGGGGGGSGSRDEDEEEKRKKRRREKFEQDRARKAEKMRQTELITGIVTNLMGTATKGIGAGAYMANQNKLAQANQAHQKEMQQNANIHNRYMIEAEKLAGNKKYRKGEDW